MSNTIAAKARPKYRALDSSKGEIRLLRILPPNKGSNYGHGLDFAADTIECRLEYAIMDDIEDAKRQAATQDMAMQDILNILCVPGLLAEEEGAEEPSPEVSRHMELIRHELERDMAELDESIDYSLHPSRKAAFQEMFQRWQQDKSVWMPTGPSAVHGDFRITIRISWHLAFRKVDKELDLDSA